VVTSTLGTRYEIDTQGAILFLEEVNEEPYQIDRMLTQLWLAGKLQQAAGIALGNFRNCEAKKKSITQPAQPLVQVLQDRLSDLGVPVVYGLPFGHVKSKLTLPLGVPAELDATNKTLRLLSEAVTV
jgi:muramoyltetrapeptide carboxypeptidase